MATKKKVVVYTNVDHKAQQYCFKRGLRITVEPVGGVYKVKYAGKYYMNGQEFTQQEAHQSCWDLYTKIYNYDKNK